MKQLLPVKRKRVRKTDGTVAHLSFAGRIFFWQLSFDLFALCFCGRLFFSPLISNKAEMNVCGNCRGRETPALCCVTQNPTRVCPSLHVSSTANHEMQIDEGVLLFDCLRSGFHLMFAVTKLSMFDQVRN